MPTTSELAQHISVLDYPLILQRFRRVLVLAGQHRGRVHSKCLFRFDDPVSPHLAARRANEGGGLQVISHSMLTSAVS